MDASTLKSSFDGINFCDTTINGDESRREVAGITKMKKPLVDRAHTLVVRYHESHGIPCTCLRMTSQKSVEHLDTS